MLRRLRSLATGEASNLIVQPLVFFVLIGLPTTFENVTGMGVVLLLLVQGSTYWIAKYLQLSRQLLQMPLSRLFLHLRWINLLVLGIALIAIAPGMRWPPDIDTWPGAGFWAFAVLEYINYFHTQLMPTPSLRGRLPRKSRLSHDLVRANGL